MKILPTAILISVTIIVTCGCDSDSKEHQLEKFITAHLEKVKPMAKGANLAEWKAANTGAPEDYNEVSKLKFKIRKIYSNTEEFAFLKDIKQSRQVKDAKLLR